MKECKGDNSKGYCPNFEMLLLLNKKKIPVFMIVSIAAALKLLVNIFIRL